jgi:hypothetical protein
MLPGGRLRLVRRGRARLLNVTVTKASDGHWYATVCYQREARTPADRHTAPVGPVVGVDRGVRTAAVAKVGAGVPVEEAPSRRRRRWEPPAKQEPAGPATAGRRHWTAPDGGAYEHVRWPDHHTVTVRGGAGRPSCRCSRPAAGP